MGKVEVVRYRVDSCMNQVAFFVCWGGLCTYNYLPDNPQRCGVCHQKQLRGVHKFPCNTATLKRVGKNGGSNWEDPLDNFWMRCWISISKHWSCHRREREGASSFWQHFAEVYFGFWNVPVL